MRISHQVAAERPIEQAAILIARTQRVRAIFSPTPERYFRVSAIPTRGRRKLTGE